MPNPTADQIDEYLTMSNASVALSDAKQRLSEIVTGLTATEPVLLNVRGKPRAAIIDIAAYRDLLARAEAAEHIILADEAEAGVRYTIDEAFDELDRRAEARRASRAQLQEAA